MKNCRRGNLYDEDTRLPDDTIQEVGTGSQVPEGDNCTNNGRNELSKIYPVDT